MEAVEAKVDFLLKKYPDLRFQELQIETHEINANSESNNPFRHRIATLMGTIGRPGTMHTETIIR